MFAYCEHCELRAMCAKAVAFHPSQKLIRNAAVRLLYQNYIVGLGMSGDELIDWIIDKIADFPGAYEDEFGAGVPLPSYLPILNPGARFWFRDQIEGGIWRAVEDVPGLRSEAVGRWRLIGVARSISETIQPDCRDWK